MGGVSKGDGELEPNEGSSDAKPAWAAPATWAAGCLTGLLVSAAAFVILYKLVGSTADIGTRKAIIGAGIAGVGGAQVLGAWVLGTRRGWVAAAFLIAGCAVAWAVVVAFAMAIAGLASQGAGH